jgi:MoaA/NifB/PqqE/SkfB family radical SAM enzyme
MKKDQLLENIINRSIKNLFYDAFRVSLKSLSQAWFILRTIKAQKKAARIRDFWEHQNLHIPPFAIISVTRTCNLKCKGCYAQVHNKPDGIELSIGNFENILNQANELGISIILIAGGEPLVRPEILKVTKKFPSIIFPLFTNGLLIDKNFIKIFKEQKNLVPILSVEGYEEETDERRGRGTYNKIKEAMQELKVNNIFYGTSITVTRANYEVVFSDIFLQNLLVSGCKLFFFVEYVPVQEGTENLVLTDMQRSNILSLMNSYRERFPALFIAFPGDEEALGGCLAAGRGFIHISPEGNVEPCPFAPYSDANLNKLSLKEALGSKLLNIIRLNHDFLQDGSSGCVLWEKRESVEYLLHKDKEYCGKG